MRTHVHVVGTVTSALIAILIRAISVFGLIAGFSQLNHQQWARSVMLFGSEQEPPSQHGAGVRLACRGDRR